MRSEQAHLRLAIVQNKDAAIGVAAWVDPLMDMGGIRFEHAEFEATAKRKPGDAADEELGRRLVTLRLLRQVVSRLEEQVGPEADPDHPAHRVAQDRADEVDGEKWLAHLRSLARAIAHLRIYQHPGTGVAVLTRAQASFLGLVVAELRSELGD